ncbi:hypothetical protein [Timonella senegalensis]|uniref:hypothetical protein n=1 Tax=Timonella senegalensis TaxID=1465825 RepID=UPI0028AD75A0|nr:hypothetical protein [Timonella senegalensis]
MARPLPHTLFAGAALVLAVGTLTSCSAEADHAASPSALSASTPHGLAVPERSDQEIARSWVSSTVVENPSPVLVEQDGTLSLSVACVAEDGGELTYTVSTGSPELAHKSAGLGAKTSTDSFAEVSSGRTVCDGTVTTVDIAVPAQSAVLLHTQPTSAGVASGFAVLTRP